jgi:hypothetical protein
MEAYSEFSWCFTDIYQIHKTFYGLHKPTTNISSLCL